MYNIVGFAIVGFIFLIVFWNEKFVLSFRFDTDMDKIVIDNQPKDCKFLTAPLGLKNCHYEAVGRKKDELLYVGWTKVLQ